jgi:D-sedoheptulose 7-phosphate isomerase
MHLAEEMIGRYRQTRPPLAAICLSADSTALTCIANDWDYSEVFARQVDALGRAGDALIVLSTSGKSPSILRALAQARMAGLVTIGLLGPAGSPATELCDLALCVDDQTPASHIQELHLAVIHAILERLDFEFGAA